MSTPEQIAADAALARRLQEEELPPAFPLQALHHLHFAHQPTSPPPPSHPYISSPQNPTPAALLEAIHAQTARPPPHGIPPALSALNQYLAPSHHDAHHNHNHHRANPQRLDPIGRRSGAMRLRPDGRPVPMHYPQPSVRRAGSGRRAEMEDLGRQFDPQERHGGQGHVHHHHHHHMHPGNDAQDGHLREVSDMLDEMFSGIFSPFAQGSRVERGMPGGVGQHITEMLRNFIPDAVEQPRQYEDWLEIIERMGGNVNRGANEREIGDLPVERFDKGLLRRVRALRRKKEGGAGSSSGGGRDDDAGEGDKCAICLGEYEDGEMVKTLPCYHVFHAECVDRWLKVNKICPFCKQSIRPGDRPAA